MSFTGLTSSYANTRSREIPIIEPDPELEYTLRRMNQNLGSHGDEVDPQMPLLVDTHDLVLPFIHGEVKYGDNLQVQALKSTTGSMKIS